MTSMPTNQPSGSNGGRASSNQMWPPNMPTQNLQGSKLNQLGGQGLYENLQLPPNSNDVFGLQQQQQLQSLLQQQQQHGSITNSLDPNEFPALGNTLVDANTQRPNSTLQGTLPPPGLGGNTGLQNSNTQDGLRNNSVSSLFGGQEGGQSQLGVGKGGALGEKDDSRDANLTTARLGSNSALPQNAVDENNVDKYGILGLLTTNEFVFQPRNFKLSLHSSDPLFPTQGLPWSDPSELRGVVEPDHVLPECYNAQKPPPALTKVSSFLNETLFYIFYTNPLDKLQLAAAEELQSRGLTYHKELQRWFERDPNTPLTDKTEQGVQGAFNFFDPRVWNFVRKDNFVIFYSSVENPVWLQNDNGVATNRNQPGHSTGASTTTMPTVSAGLTAKSLAMSQQQIPVSSGRSSLVNAVSTTSTTLSSEALSSLPNSQFLGQQQQHQQQDLAQMGAGGASLLTSGLQRNGLGQNSNTNLSSLLQNISPQNLPPQHLQQLQQQHIRQYQQQQQQQGGNPTNVAPSMLLNPRSQLQGHIGGNLSGSSRSMLNGNYMLGSSSNGAVSGIMSSSLQGLTSPPSSVSAAGSVRPNAQTANSLAEDVAVTSLH